MGAAEALGGACHHCLNRSSRVLSHFAIPHAKDAPAVLGKPLIAHDITFRSRVLPAIGAAAGEIDDVRADRKLAGELGPVAERSAQIFRSSAVAWLRSVRARLVTSNSIRRDMARA